MVLYTIYTISVKDKIYVGATSNYNNRIKTHIACLNKKIKSNNKQTYWMKTYSLFEVSELINYGFIFNVYCYCNNAAIAQIIEGKLIDKYKAIGVSLNVSDKSGYSYTSRQGRNKRKRAVYTQIKQGNKLVIVRTPPQYK